MGLEIEEMFNMTYKEKQEKKEMICEEEEDMGILGKRGA